MKKILIGVVLCALIIPLASYAQYGGGRGVSRSIQRKINNLDDDRVEKLFIPILFGVQLVHLTENFGDPRDGGARSHEGLDIMAPKGAPIISPTEAIVTRTGNGSGSGKYVYTANPGGETFRYMHLDEILVDAGDELDAGDIVGYVGNTGNAAGGPAHLHFEIRDGRSATDPYPRITKELSLRDKITYLEEALDTVSDEDELIDFVVAQYASELRQATMAGIKLPADITKVFGTTTQTPETAQTSLDLEVGAEGPLVTALQAFLILKNSGPNAQKLAGAGATGYFGPITQAALAEYQRSVGITPAVGYFGPLTRAYILAHEK